MHPVQSERRYLRGRRAREVGVGGGGGRGGKVSGCDANLEIEGGVDGRRRRRRERQGKVGAHRYGRHVADDRRGGASVGGFWGGGASWAWWGWG